MYWRNYRTSILLAVTFTILLSTFWYMPDLAFIIFLSLLLQLLLRPPVDFLAHRIPRALAAGVVLTCFVTVAALFLAVISGSFLPTFKEFVTDFPRLTEKIQNMPIFDNMAFLRGEIDNLWSNLMNASALALRSSLTILLSIFGKFIDLVIIFFVTFYLLADGEQIKSYLAGLFPHADYGRVLNLFDRILSALRVYVLSQLTICLITALIVFSYFYFRGLSYASVFAVVSGVSEFVPVLGPTVASAFGTLLTATQNPWLSLQTLGFYLILTQVNHNIIYPTLIGKSLHLHPIAIILGIILGGEVLGAAGMFLAVPFIVICKLVIEDIYLDRAKRHEDRAKSRWLRQ
ncbi:MAG: AI-2E family transporter [Selenomonadaceae bacterium]|nr:AI-2E family transporter [Selenomonadaceae bacterium]